MKNYYFLYNSESCLYSKFFYKMKFTGIESNLWKYFLIIFTNRRNFIPILSVYYLTLPNTHANEIGLFTGIGYFAAMVMQMPSGWIADHYGQKNTLIFAKILIIFSSIFYLVADNFYVFTLGSICMSLGLEAFSSWTTASFLKWTLEKLGRWNEFKKISSRISGDVALYSILFIVGLPLLTEIDIRLPLFIGLFIDIIGLLIALSLFPVHIKIEKNDRKWILTIFREMRGTGFFPFAVFSAVISGFLFADNAYRWPYLIELGYPLAFIGLVMGGSRLVWWWVGRSVNLLEKYISFKNLILIELIIFPLYYIWVGYISNPWILWIVFSCVVGWFWWRSQIYTDYFIDRIPDSRYRATVLSMKSQITGFFQIFVSFGIAWVMGISYELGFQTLGVIMFIFLSGIYFFGIRKISI